MFINSRERYLCHFGANEDVIFQHTLRSSFHVLFLESGNKFKLKSRSSLKRRLLFPRNSDRQLISPFCRWWEFQLISVNYNNINFNQMMKKKGSCQLWIIVLMEQWIDHFRVYLVLLFENEFSCKTTFAMYGRQISLSISEFFQISLCTMTIKKEDLQYADTWVKLIIHFQRSTVLPTSLQK